MNELLKKLLWDIRQNPAFPDLLKAVERPKLPRFKANSGETAEQFGARAIHVSGQQAQHDSWIALLTNGSPQGDD